MLKVNQLAGFGAGRAPSRPASYVFNGTDERLFRVLSTSAPSTTVFTFSAWVKLATGVFGLINTGYLMTGDLAANPLSTQIRKGSGDLDVVGTVAGAGVWGEFMGTYEGDPAVADNLWHHIVVRYDSTQGVAEDRIRMYLNGTLRADGNFTSGQPAASEAHCMFNNGLTTRIGWTPNIFMFGKFAFLELLEGVSQDATAFGFDNAGTWTRKPYTGSYGSYGWRLDGSSLFNDMSGNGQHFTPENMDATNLDPADLPPFVA